MNKAPLSRRGFLQASAATLSLSQSLYAQRKSLTPADYRQFQLRKETAERVEVGRQIILDELKPTQAQLQRGLDLHFNSYVAEVMGSLYVADPVITMIGDRLREDLAQFRQSLEAKGIGEEEREQRVQERWRRMKAFESAFDPQWRQDYLGLYRLTGVDLAIEDVAHPPENTFRRALKHLARCQYVYESGQDVVKVSRFEDIQRARDEGKPALIYHLAGVGSFAEADTPLENLDLLYALGVRATQLTYRQKNLLCSSDQQRRDTGLTPLGRRVVRRLNDLGVMIHLAHAGERTALEVIEVSEAPVYNAHVACKAIYDSPRRIANQDDHYLRSLARKGGLAAVYAWPRQLSERESPTFDDFARHLEHAIQVAGIDHVAIGTDLTFLPHPTASGIHKPHAMDWTNWPYFTVGLVCRGFSDDEIQKILGKNFLSFARQVLDRKPWGPLI